MQFKVKDIGEAGLDVDLAVTAAWLEQSLANCADLDLVPDAGGLRFKGRIERTGDDYLLRGKLQGGAHVPCARCLEPAKLPLDVDVSVIYVEREGEGEDDDEGGELDDDTLDAPDVLTFSDGLIDLGPELRDELLLAVPVSVLCQDDCAGLCPVCGGNRNTRPCDCAERERVGQSKFAALAKLKT